MNSEKIVSKTISGLKWNYLSTIITSIFQLIHTAIISRILDPSVFGLLAMANLVLRFGVYFSRMGIGSAIIQKRELSKDDVRASFTMSIMFSGAVTGIVIILAPFSKYLFNSSEVVNVVRVLSLTMLINGFNIVAVNLIRRNFEYKSLFYCEIVSYFVGSMLVGIPMAYLGYGVWSLVVASIVQGIILTIMAYAFVKHPIKPLFSLSVYRPLFSFGSKVFTISFLEFANYNIDSALIGRSLGETQLGLYNRAHHIIDLPSEKITTSLTQVLFSSFSNIQENLRQVRKAYLLSDHIVGLVLIPLTFSMSGAAREFVLVILGNKWVDAIPILQIISISTAFILLNNINGIMFEAMGWLKEKLILVTSRLILISLALSITIDEGLEAVSLGVLLVAVVHYFTYSLVGFQRVKASFSEFIDIQKNLLLIGIVSFIGTRFVSIMSLILNLNLYITFIFQVLFGGTVLLFFTFVHPPFELSKFMVQHVFSRNDSSKNVIMQFIQKHYNDLLIKNAEVPIKTE